MQRVGFTLILSVGSGMIVRSDWKMIFGSVGKLFGNVLVMYVKNVCLRRLQMIRWLGVSVSADLLVIYSASPA